MSDILPISVFIFARNGADRIAPAIRSVRDWVDEAIVIDSGSRDDTVAVAESPGARVTFDEWRGRGPAAGVWQAAVLHPPVGWC